MAEEALKCFTTLLESIPGWIADLEDILATAADRQKQLLFENQPQEEQDEQPIDSCHSRPRKASKTSSVRSRHSQVSRPDLPTANDIDASPPTQVQVPHMTQSDALRLAQRKRKTASAVSDLEGAPYKYRSRSMAVIYYDGETQKRFEGMVRKIGSCRNSLRKGKVSAFYVVMSSLDAATGDGLSDGSGDLPKIAFRSTRSRRPPPAEKGDETQSFDMIDQCLEQAQSMCERAAHQILRDGDCAEELKQAKEQFAEARKIGEAESLIWERRSKEAEGKASRRSGGDDAESGVSRSKIGPSPISSSEEKLIADTQPAYRGSHEVEVAIEADTSDDDDTEDLPVDMMQLPRPYPKRPQVHGKSLWAG